MPVCLAHAHALMTGCAARGVAVVRIFCREGPATRHNPLAAAGGLIRPLDDLAPCDASATFDKQRHSALVGTDLPVWLRQHRIHWLIAAGVRTGQCCETTVRHTSDEGIAPPASPPASICPCTWWCTTAVKRWTPPSSR